MDLIALGQTAIIIPTPGQTEQEYLCQRLHEKKFFFCVKQENMDLNRQIDLFLAVKNSLKNNILQLAQHTKEFKNTLHELGL